MAAAPEESTGETWQCPGGLLFPGKLHLNPLFQHSWSGTYTNVIFKFPAGPQLFSPLYPLSPHWWVNDPNSAKAFADFTEVFLNFSLLSSCFFFF